MQCHTIRFLLALIMLAVVTQAFAPAQPASPMAQKLHRTKLTAEPEESSRTTGVVELGDNIKAEKEGLPKAVSGPLFISQGEVDPDTLNPDFSDAKQTRVVIYTILSLLPVLFLIPFMLGRDFIPADALPPVEMSM